MISFIKVWVIIISVLHVGNETLRLLQGEYFFHVT